MIKNTDELKRIMGIKLDCQNKIKDLSTQISTIQSQILAHPLSADVSAKLELSSKLKKGKSDIEQTLGAVEYYLRQAYKFEIIELTSFLMALISAVEEKKYELSLTYSPAKEGSSKPQEVYVVADKIMDLGELDKISDIIKIQEFQDYKEVLFAIKSTDKSYISIESLFELYSKFPYLKEVFEVLISRKLEIHDRKTAVDEVSNLYLTEYENLSKEDKDKLRKREL